MNKPIISVVMSVFNGSDFIAEAINSVLGQTFSNFELLITDDCSTDNTVEIIKGFKDNRIKFFQNDVKIGKTINRNNMIRSSLGDIIAVLDADDVCLPKRLQEEYEFLNKHKDVFMVCSYAKAIGSKKGLLKTPYFRLLKSQLIFNNPVVHSTVMFWKNPNYFYDESFVRNEDYELWDRIVFSDKKIQVLKKTMCLYRYHNNQTTNKNNGLKAYGNIVRIRALKRLGIDLNEEEIIEWLTFVKLGQIKSKEHYYFVLKILGRIIKANQKNKLYDSFTLRKLIIKKRFLALIKLKRGISNEK